MKKQKFLGVVAMVLFVSNILTTIASLPIFDAIVPVIVRWVPICTLAAFALLWVIDEITETWEIRRKD